MYSYARLKMSNKEEAIAVRDMIDVFDGRLNPRIEIGTIGWWYVRTDITAPVLRKLQDWCVRNEVKVHSIDFSNGIKIGAFGFGS